MVYSLLYISYIYIWDAAPLLIWWFDNLFVYGLMVMMMMMMTMMMMMMMMGWDGMVKTLGNNVGKNMETQ